MFNTILIQPMINVLILFYSLFPIHSLGIAIILLTLLIRLALWPLQSQTLRSQKALNKLQPEINKIQQKYKNDPKKVQEMTLELYKEKEVNPLSSCLPTLIQLPLLFALFYALIKFKDPAYYNLMDPNSGLMTALYPWVKDLKFVQDALSQPLNTYFLGINLVKNSLLLAILAGGTQFLQTKLMTPKNQGTGQAAQTMNMMLYMFPLLTVFIGATMPGALPLYWIVTSGMAALQQYLIMYRDVEVLDEEAVIEVEAEEKAVKSNVAKAMQDKPKQVAAKKKPASVAKAMQDKKK
jgi:YidC/Oxa1 family membrane protein insertase